MSSSFSVIRVAATFAGTIIGAGFASGQEIAQFFVCYGPSGLMGIIAATGLFAWLGGALLEFGFRLKASAYDGVIYHLCGRRIGFFIDLITVVFLFVALAIMLAGAAAVLKDYFGVPPLFGLAAFAFAVMSAVLFGVKGITAANMIITPILVVSIILIGGYSLFYHELDFALPDASQKMIFPAPHWLVASLLYVSYNLMISSTVLVPLGKTIKAHKVRFWGGLAGGLLLGLLAMFVAIVIMIHYPEIMVHEVPLLFIASSQHLWSGTLYGLAMLAAIYTTALAGLYGCLSKMQSEIKLNQFVSVLMITGAAAICSQAGFSTLIRILFPVFGYVTLIFTARLAWLACRGN